MFRATSAIERCPSMTNLTASSLYSPVKLRRVAPIRETPEEWGSYHLCPPDRGRFKQRIGMRYLMPPMTDTETRDYIHHHVRLAGRADPLFTDDAITVIHTASRGYPRAINNIAVHALTAA